MTAQFEPGTKHWALTITAPPVLKKVRGRNQAYVQCDCDCGNRDVTMALTLIKYGYRKSCGCDAYRNTTVLRRTVAPPIGTRIKHLTVTGGPQRRKINGYTRTFVLCDCDCGAKDVLIRLSLIDTGNVASCGCMARNKMRSFRVTADEKNVIARAEREEMRKIQRMNEIMRGLPALQSPRLLPGAWVMLH